MVIDEKDRESFAYLEKAIPIIGTMGLRIDAFKKGFVRVTLPKDPNINHIGTVYAGSLFSLADFAGGVLFFASFDYTAYYPILKEVTITFKKPAVTDITVEATMAPEQMEDLERTADETGKATWMMDLELRDQRGEVCCLVRGTFQMRNVRSADGGGTARVTSSPPAVLF